MKKKIHLLEVGIGTDMNGYTTTLTQCKRKGLAYSLGSARVTCLACRRALLKLVARALGAKPAQTRNDDWLTIAVLAKAA